ncbi:MAG: ATP-binding protein [Gaiellaceae bacterium]
MALTCSRCSRENPDDARFCLACGAPLAAPAQAAEERKVVSVLFVDLVGFTAASETADPEDVRARLREYHARTKEEVERYGGVVEKFVGDAVMAVFGAPVAHEDDAERAVRAALRALEAVAELGLEARAAVNTGEALVTLGARPAEGEAMVAGDVVNTAARLQGAAPVGAVVVGEVTFRATGTAIDYEPLEPVELKGKTEPAQLWRATGARSRFGIDLEPARGTPFLGREHELTVLKEAFLRAERERAVQLVTVTGEPGVGKSRLVGEFRAWLDDRAELVRWRQGRCLPYGEGITFWALGEIVKAHAGILESDPPATAVEKLRDALGGAPDREWLVTRLAPLVGAESAQAPRTESFTAWRRFLEDVAAERPLVAVVEDLHWADASLIEFLEHVVDWGSDVPLLVLCSARPELYERYPGWGGGKRNSTTLALSPLTAEDTTRLVSSLLEQAVLPAETQAALLERGGGNPLFTVEFVRMLVDRGALDSRARIAGETIAVPDSVQALIASRLDTLTVERKSLLHDAAVLGKVFWAGALAAMGRRDSTEVDAGLRELVRKELIRPARLSSVEGDAEFSFWHASIRDVAYGQLPRDARTRKHAAAARWIEQTTPENVEVLAHHWDEALRLAEAAGAAALATECRPSAQRFHFLAGERTMPIDLHAAERHFVRARELAEDRSAEAGWATVRLMNARELLGTVSEDAARAELQEALRFFEESGDEPGRAAALGQISSVAWRVGDEPECLRLGDERLAILEALPASRELVSGLIMRAFYAMTAGDNERALELADRGLATAKELDLRDWSIMLGLQTRGAARSNLGEADGLDDFREAVDYATASGHALAIAYINYAYQTWHVEGPAAALALQQRAVEEGERRGQDILHMLGERAWTLFEVGEWDEVLALAERVLSSEREHEREGQPGMMVAAMRVQVLARRGDLAAADAEIDSLLPRARRSPLQVHIPALAAAITVAHLRGATAEAVSLAEELEQEQARRTVLLFGIGHTDAVRACVAAGQLELAERLVAGMHPHTLHEENFQTACRAILAEARDEIETARALYEDAAARFAAWPFPLEQALALQGLARCGGNAGDAAAILARLGVRDDQTAVRRAK